MYHPVEFRHSVWVTTVPHVLQLYSKQVILSYSLLTASQQPKPASGSLVRRAGKLDSTASVYDWPVAPQAEAYPHELFRNFHGYKYSRMRKRHVPFL